MTSCARRNLSLIAIAVTIASGCGARTGLPIPDPEGAFDSGIDASRPEDGGSCDDPDAPFDVALDTTGTLDPTRDNDGDGYLFKDDCNDRDPLVNPGAFEFVGDGVDNDCDGRIDVDDTCDLAEVPFDTSDPNEFARALGICKTTTEGATGKERRWGLLRAELVRADGSAAPDRRQYAVMTRFGAKVLPRAGSKMVVLSNGTARLPEMKDFQRPRLDSLSISGSEVTPPPGFPKNTAGCADPETDKANDSVNLRLTLRVPTNARAFRFDFDFYSSEYLDYVCSPYNDTFAAILHTKAPLDPKLSNNVSFDTKGNPINVNSGFFEVCTPGMIHAGGKNWSFSCPKGTDELIDTGFWEPDAIVENGSTSWLETKAPVVPGEIMTLELMIWDTSDHVLDSTVLVDDFRWDRRSADKPVTGRPDCK